MRRVVTGFAVTALLASGCQSEPNAAPDLPRMTFASVDEMRAVLEQGGIECDMWSYGRADSEARERAYCSHDLVFSIHTPAGNGVRENERVFALVGRANHVVGTGWSINCGGGEKCEQIRSITGGTILSR
jgi:hypothetical protein